LALPLVLNHVLHHWHNSSETLWTLGGIAASAVLLQAWLPQTASVINGPGWSLSVEAFFYLLFPFAVVALTRLSERRLLITVLLLWAAFLLVPLAYVLAHGSGSGMSLGEIAVAYNPALHVREFLIGVAGALVFNRRPQHISGWLAPASLAVAFMVLAFSSHIPLLLIQNGLLAPIFGLLVLGLSGDRGLLVRFLSWKPITVLGEASYSVYILQVPLWYPLLQISSRVFHNQTPYLGHPLYFIAYSVLLIAASIAALYLIETPARRAIRRKFGIRRAIPDAPPVITPAGQADRSAV
jgi:peptidoglycan/LPS O-acetylase OafA/YrhL